MLFDILVFYRTKENRPQSKTNPRVLNLAVLLGIFTARKRSLGQGNIFAPVCHSVHRGGCFLLGGVLPPGGRGGASSGGGAFSRGKGGGGCFLRGCFLLGGGASSQGGSGDPSPKTATAVGGTHPTGMHSCIGSIFRVISIDLLVIMDLTYLRY